MKHANLGLQLLHELRLPLLPLLVSGEFTLVGRLLLVQPPAQIHVLLSQAARLWRIVASVPSFKTQRLLQLKVRGEGFGLISHICMTDLRGTTMSGLPSNTCIRVL